MFNVHRVFRVWFSDAEITPTRKLAFADDTRARIAANNAGGVFDLILPPLDAAITAAGGAQGSEEVALAVRKAAVQAKRAKMDQIKNTISRRAGRITSTYGKDNPIYTEFFPQGLTAYRNMTEGEVSPKLQVFIAAAGMYEPDLAMEFEVLKMEWEELQTTAENKIAGVSAADGDQDEALAALDLVLMKVVFTAGLAFTGEVAMGPILFNQSKLYAPGHYSDPDPEPDPEPPVVP